MTRIFVTVVVALAACTPTESLPSVCDPACSSGQVCVNAQCLAPADGGSDAAVDVLGIEVAVDAALEDFGADVAPDVSVDALPDGCVSGTVGNCCGTSCSTPPGASSAACRAGVCGVGTCNAGFGDCDSNSANGCETNLQTTATSCGACGAPCASGRGCVAGACIECDHDGDGATIPACGGMDCDDNDRARHPGAAELCNGLDDNCDGVADAAANAALNTYCGTLTPMWFGDTRHWDGPVACAPNVTSTTVPGYETATLACRRCWTQTGSDGGVQRLCSCAVDLGGNWGCNP